MSPSLEKSTTFVHAALTVSSEERAKKIFGELFGLSVTREFDLGEEATRALFEMEGRAQVIVFDCGGVPLEIFVDSERVGHRETFDHICLAVPNRRALLERADGMGLRTRRLPKGEQEVVFLRDLDGNWIEVKEKNP